MDEAIGLQRHNRPKGGSLYGRHPYDGGISLRNVPLTPLAFHDVSETSICPSEGSKSPLSTHLATCHSHTIVSTFPTYIAL